MSRSRSSPSAVSSLIDAPSSSASFSRNRAWRRNRSTAFRRAVVSNQAPGLSGMPSFGQCSTASSSASWTSSSARSKSPSARTNAAVNRPVSRLSLRLAPIDHRTDFDEPSGRPFLRHLDRLVQVSDIDLGIAADYFLAFDEGAVRDDRLAVVELDGGRCPLWLELVPSGDLAPVFAEPL